MCHFVRDIKAMLAIENLAWKIFQVTTLPAFPPAIGRGAQWCTVAHDDIFVPFRRKIGRLERSVGIIAPLRHWNCIVARWCTKHTLHGFLAEVLAPSSHYRENEGNSILIPARGPSRNRAGKRPPYCGQGWARRKKNYANNGDLIFLVFVRSPISCSRTIVCNSFVMGTRSLQIIEIIVSSHRARKMRYCFTRVYISMRKRSVTFLTERGVKKVRGKYAA